LGVQPAPVRARSIPRRRFTPELLDSLYTLANRLLSEDAAHFRVHAETNEVVHIYERADTGAPVGFQFWRTAPMDLPGCRALIGGKLRVDPAFRRRGLRAGRPSRRGPAPDARTRSACPLPVSRERSYCLVLCRINTVNHGD